MSDVRPVNVDHRLKRLAERVAYTPRDQRERVPQTDWAAGLIRRRIEMIDLPEQFRRLHARDVPENLKINLKVVMDQDVAQSGDSAPVCIRESAPHFVRKFLRRFADNLQIANDCVLSFSSA
jgi:hypothetical protein